MPCEIKLKGECLLVVGDGGKCHEDMLPDARVIYITGTRLGFVGNATWNDPKYAYFFDKTYEDGQTLALYGNRIAIAVSEKPGKRVSK